MPTLQSRPTPTVSVSKVSTITATRPPELCSGPETVHKLLKIRAYSKTLQIRTMHDMQEKAQLATSRGKLHPINKTRIN